MKAYPSLTLEAPPPGLYRDIPASDYHAWRAVSSSLLKSAASGLPGAHHYLHDKSPKGWSTWFGTFIHAWLLEPDTVRSQGEIAKLSPKAQGETFVKAQREHGCVVPIAEGWIEMAQKIEKAVKLNGLAQELIDDCDKEVSIVYKDFTSSFQQCTCKARLDGWNPREGVIVDIKTADDPTEFAFERAASNFGYHIQAAHYIKSLWITNDSNRIPDFQFVVIRNKEPFDVCVYRALEDKFIAPGMAARDELLNAIVTADRLDTWHQEQTEPHPLSLAKWAGARFADGGF